MGYRCPQPLQQPIRKYTLPRRNKNRSSQCLRENHTRGPDTHVVELKHCLRSHEWLVHAEPAAEAEAGLVADPAGVAGIDFPSCEEASADGDENGGDEHEGGVVACYGDEDAGEEGGEDVGHDEGEIHDARLGGGDALDGLEPDG